MRVELWQYQDVSPDGIVPSGGSVVTFPRFHSSRENEYDTPSSRQCGDWVSVSTGRLPDGTVTGVTLYFGSRDEMQDFICDSGIS
jgi:hypothetical protein